MKKQMTWLLLFGAVSVAVLSLAEGAPGEKPAANRETVEMRNEIIELRAKIQTLEARLGNLESTVEQSKPRQYPVPLSLQPGNPAWPNPLSDSPSPKIWGKKEVNGWAVYIVPCEQPEH